MLPAEEICLLSSIDHLYEGLPLATRNPGRVAAFLQTQSDRL